MRFHPRRWFRRPLVREDVTTLTPQNRCLVSLLLFLLALTGTWNVALWLATDADFSYSNFVDNGDYNTSQANTSTTLRFQTIATVISVLAQLSAVSSTSTGDEYQNGTTASARRFPATESRNASSAEPCKAAIKFLSSPGPLASTGQLVKADVNEPNAANQDRSVSPTTITFNSDKLLNISGFTFLHNNITACEEESYVVLVHSAAANQERRQMIRKTWGNHRPVFFMLGQSSNQAVQTAIDEESVHHGDIIQGSFVDAYRNLTYKHVMALRWALRSCPNTDFIVKVDDDVFVNTNLLEKYLGNLQQVDDVSSAERHCGESLILCDVVSNAYVKRSYRSKWRLGFREYRSDKYPPYCNGWAVIYSRNAVSLLLNQTERVPFLWVDDVFVTGLLAERAGIKLTQMEGSLIAGVDKYKKKLDSSHLDSFAEHVVLGPPQLDLKEMENLWYFVSSHKKKRSDTKSVILSYY